MELNYLTHSRKIDPSELIVDDHQRIYHLQVSRDQVAETIIFVGDPQRVNVISSFFNQIEYYTHNREFCTCTGFYNNKRLSVISTGIGTGNIDIALSELDALFNIDFTTRKIKPNLTSLSIIRMGTCGGIHPNISIGSLLVSAYAIGLDGLMNFYDFEFTKNEKKLLDQVMTNIPALNNMIIPYVAEASKELISPFYKTCKPVITVTADGFYGPQGRILRLRPKIKIFSEQFVDFNFENMPIGNLEMETAGIYGLGSSLGHRCCSISIVVADRMHGEFLTDIAKPVKDMIETLLPIIADVAK